MALIGGAAAALRVCALLACHNRRDATLACLASLGHSAAAAQIHVNAVLVDDGSHDGTATAVSARFDWVQVIPADGSLYWCRAMHRAWLQARASTPDFLLWLNDDVTLAPQALAVMLQVAVERRVHGRGCVVVGGLSDAGRPCYGGLVAASRWRRTAWRLLSPGDAAQPIETFDGNLVLVDAEAAARVGPLDAAFEHAMGDTDWGLRAKALGVGLWLAPGVLGRCPLNPREAGFDDPALPLRERWRRMLARKGLPWRSWLRFTRRHAGALWPLAFAWPYLRVTLGLRPRR